MMKALIRPETRRAVRSVARCAATTFWLLTLSIGSAKAEPAFEHAARPAADRFRGDRTGRSRDAKQARADFYRSWSNHHYGIELETLNRAGVRLKMRPDGRVLAVAKDPAAARARLEQHGLTWRGESGGEGHLMWVDRGRPLAPEQRHARERMFSALQQPEQKLRLEGLDRASPKQRRLVEFYRDKVWPVLQRNERLDREIGIHWVALDRALYTSPAEMKQWEARRDSATAQLSEAEADPEWQTTIDEFGKLAQGLDGELAERARSLAREVKARGMTPEQARLHTEHQKILGKIRGKANTSELVEQLPVAEEQINAAVDAFHSGDKTFEDAWRAVEEHRRSHRAAHGRDIAERAGEELQRNAEILSQLATERGHETWAADRLAADAANHAEGLRTVADRKQFLEQLLDATEPIYRELLEKRLAAVGGPKLDDLRDSQLQLLKPRDPRSTREYFPKDKLVEIWQRTMRESGFSEQAIDATDIDVFPREGKQTHAYMFAMGFGTPKELTIDAETLDVQHPDARSEYVDPLIYIVQNFRDDGIDPLRTMFHEGGHRLDFFHRADPLGGLRRVDSSDRAESYGYAETHSTTMEAFASDKEFLARNGRTRDGKPIPADLVDAMVRDAAVGKLLDFRLLVGRALFDLELWDHDYNKPQSEGFVDRARRLYSDVVGKATLAKADAAVDGGWRDMAFATGHFYSGGVEYFGYVGADVAARATHDAVLDRLERDTGRRTLSQQPTLAGILSEGYYKSGFDKPFPKATEAFTGKRFSPKAFAESLAAPVRAYLDGLDDNARD